MESCYGESLKELKRALFHLDFSSEIRFSYQKVIKTHPRVTGLYEFSSFQFDNNHTFDVPNHKYLDKFEAILLLPKNNERGIILRLNNEQKNLNKKYALAQKHNFSVKMHF